MIKAVKQGAPDADLQIFDAPPGTSCPVIQTVRDADYVVLVTEPTPFGLNDLRLAVEMLRELNKPFGVVINRADVGDDGVTRYCAEEEIEILVEIPDDRKVAEAYARGDIAVRVLPEYRDIFQGLLNKVVDRARKYSVIPKDRHPRGAVIPRKRGSSGSEPGDRFARSQYSTLADIARSGSDEAISRHPRVPSPSGRV